MIKKINAIGIALAILGLLSLSNLSAEGGEDMFKNTGKGRLIFGGHLYFDPNGLGGTVIKDGLSGGTRIISKDLDSNGTYETQVLSNQSAFIPDNKLTTLHHLTGGGIHTKAGGPMQGGGLTLGYEKDVGENFFWRVGLNISTKISGGHTTSSIGPYKWYDVYWNFRSAVIPAYFGIKLNFGEKSSFYVAPGLHYFRAMWNVKGYNDGDALAAALGSDRMNQLPVIADSVRPGARQEDTVFSAGGVGFNYIIGAHTKVSDKGFIFMEVETLVSGNLTAVGATKSSGGLAALSPYPVYPVSVAGNYYRFGYKLEL
ncbi:MAG: porin OmpL1 [Leptospiraceae bacterium]|nr:porin OmpL1 [Leptospiraceae bacterium]